MTSDWSSARLAVAGMIDLLDGRRIWIPPTGRPFWTHTQPTRVLTDDELAEFGLRDGPQPKKGHER